jgi:hypothetical protein
MGMNTVSRALSGVLLAVSLAAAGCASTTVIHGGSPRYEGSPSKMFQVALRAVQSAYDVVGIDAEHGRVLTSARWYGPDGSEQGETVADGSILLRYEVTLRSLGSSYGVTSYVVDVFPVMQQRRTGSAELDLLAPDDPTVPLWVRDRTAGLAWRIDDALESYRVLTRAETTPTAIAQR